MAMMEGPTLLDIAEYNRNRPNRLLEQQLDDISYYTVYVRLDHRDHADKALSNPTRVSTLSEDMGKKVINLFFLDEDLNEIDCAQGSMVNGIWIPSKKLSIEFMGTSGVAREGFLRNYDDGLDLSMFTESATKELVAI